MVAPVPDDCEGMGKVLMCHIPRGNPDNAHEICISASAVPAHLAHGDTEGGCGGGPGGPGFQLPAGNNAPLWALGYGFPADMTYQTVGQLPWSDDWNGGRGPVQGASADQARVQLVEFLSQYTPDADGMVNVSIAKISINGETRVLSEAFDFQVGIELEGSGWSYRLATPDRHLFPELVDVIVNNTSNRGELDLSGWSFEMGDGQILQGALITRSLRGAVTLNHDGLVHYAQNAMEPLADNSTNRLENIRTSR